MAQPCQEMSVTEGTKKYNMKSFVHDYGKEGNILLSPHIQFYTLKHIQIHKPQKISQYLHLQKTHTDTSVGAPNYILPQITFTTDLQESRRSVPAVGMRALHLELGSSHLQNSRNYQHVAPKSSLRAYIFYDLP